MKVEQLIKNTVQRECFFVTGKIDIAVDYFIKEIEKGKEELPSTCSY